MNKIITIKLLAIGVIVMGFVHIAATFSPMIAGKLAPLSEGMQRACIYFSLMCGAMLILGGASYICCVEKQRNTPFCARFSS